MTPSVEGDEIVMFRKDRFFILRIAILSAKHAKEVRYLLQEEAVCPEWMYEDYGLEGRVDVLSIV
jgi:hypothetical protein